ncbi:hypothetical protein [Halorubrum ezzemoulense]|uniref:hypothetical protein n=1 Tax=Halorubrum ezzemoulense TaxID=337243 RepID=UPI00232AF20E|nr:hypothetical protein [Halorubrum ezzemoulense]MDB9252660.1 hypothetical protein [Halorubrum ezzemoulense]MDB9257183.1 hypothetical protein [Halorubrum ezzemoulense]MDB9277265.1 hypothetical protein [Halorubrum ezzemoulense]
MIVLANRVTLDKRTLLTWIHTQLRTQAGTDAPVEQVRYYPLKANKLEVRATIHQDRFLDASYPVSTVQLHVSFDSPTEFAYDFYRIQWVDSDREIMLGWHQDETHMGLGECRFQLDYRGDTIHRAEAEFLDRHPRNVFDHRIAQLVDVVDGLTWTDSRPVIPDVTGE